VSGLIPKALFVTLLVALDQASKWATEAYLPWQENIGFVPFISLFRTHNFGVAFSMFSDAGALPLLALTAAICTVIVWMWARLPPNRHLAQFGLAFIIGGALGNLIDRAWHGYVIDMIRFHTETWSFAIFNVADSFITIGATLVIADELLAMLKQKRNTGQDKTP
jgi:signal peptidase II